MRRKSFSLVLLIFIVVAVILTVVFSISLINGFGSNNHNSKDKSKKKNETEVSQTNNISENILDNSFFDSLDVIENGVTNTVNSTSTSNSAGTSNTTVPQENTNSVPTENLVSLNNHSYKFDSSVQATAKTASNGKQELQITYPEKKYTINYGTDSSKSFEDLKNDADIKTTLENSYNITVTSALKQGTVSNMNLIICTVTEDNKTAYFLATPLKDNEIAYAKIYNSENSQSLVDDLSDPLASVSSVISSVQ